MFLVITEHQIKTERGWQRLWKRACFKLTDADVKAYRNFIQLCSGHLTNRRFLVKVIEDAAIEGWMNNLLTQGAILDHIKDDAERRFS